MAGVAPRFSVVILGEQPLLSQCGDLLLDLGHRIVGVATTTSANERWAREHGLPLWKKDELAARIEDAKPDLLLSITWPWLVPAAALAHVRRLALNFHDGPLPRYAGMNGSAWALARGERAHAIVWHEMTAGLDEGPILKRRDLVLEPRETSVSLHIKNAGAALESFLELLNELENGVERRTPQDRAVERLEHSRHDRPAGLGVLDVRQRAEDLDRLVRACDFGPYPNAFAATKLVHGDAAILVDEVRVEHADAAQPAGTVTRADAGGLVIACGAEALSVLRARTLEGAPLSTADAVRVLGVAPGTRLVDDAADARARVSRAVAVAEPFHLTRLTRIARGDVARLPFMPPRENDERAPLSIPLAALDVPGATADHVVAARVGAFAFVCSALCGRDEVSFACALRRTMDVDDAVTPLLMPAAPLGLTLDDTQGFHALTTAVDEHIRALRDRAPPLVDLLARTPALAPLRGRPMAPLAVALDGRSAPPGAALCLCLAPGSASLVADPAQLRAEDARDLAARLERVAQRLVAEPDRPLRTVDLLADDERERVVFGWNATDEAFPEDERIHDRFEEQARLRPDALAVVCESQRATFGELDARANRIAHVLASRGAGPGKHVAFCLPRGIDMVATMLAIAKTGAAYVPIDHGLPRERATFMLDDAHALLVVTHDKLAERFGGRPIVIVDSSEVLRAPEARPACAAVATDACYAIYTSGSTGQPKGVVLSHRAVTNTLRWVTRTFGVSARDRLLFVTSPGFDLSVYDVFGALGAGAVVEVASAERLAEPALLARRVIEAGVTIWNSAPPALSRLMPSLPSRAPESTLRLVMLSGDWIPLPLPGQLRAVFPRVEVKSLGGATEAAIWSNWFDVHDVDPAWSSIPYGRPIANARYMVLDRRLRAVPPGVAGDLVIGGVCLADGYLGRPDLTAERFVPDPFRPGERIYKTGDVARFWQDGTLELLGRSDFQVKVRGFRVELGEIERALLQQPGVRECVVDARKDGVGERILVGYVVAEDGATLDAAQLKRTLAARLPDYMVPAFVMALPRLPLTANGKIDRAALPAPGASGPVRVAPRTPTERALHRIWSELLRVESIGVTDTFFDLGGHSMMAVLLVARTKEALGVALPLSHLISHPTIEALAREIDRRGAPGAVDARSQLVPLREHGDRPPLFLIAGIGGHVFGMRDLALRLPDDQPVYAFRAIGAEDGELPRDSIEEIARAYEADVLAAARGRPVVLGGYSFGALVAFELARRLRRRGVPIVRVVLLDVYAPGYPKKAVLPKRALLHARHFATLDLRGKRDYLEDRAKNVAKRALVKTGLGAIVAPRVAHADADKEAQLRTLWAALAQAQERYAPGGPDIGPVTLFRAAENPRWPGVVFDDDAQGWRAWVTGPLEVIRLRGAHLDVLEPDNLDTIGRALSERLR